MYDSIGITTDMIAPIIPFIIGAAVIALIISIPILIVRVKLERAIERKEMERKMRLKREIANKIRQEENGKRTTITRTSRNARSSGTKR